MVPEPRGMSRATGEEFPAIPRAWWVLVFPMGFVVVGWVFVVWLFAAQALRGVSGWTEVAVYGLVGAAVCAYLYSIPLRDLRTAFSAEGVRKPGLPRAAFISGSTSGSSTWVVTTPAPHCCGCGPTVRASSSTSCCSVTPTA